MDTKVAFENYKKLLQTTIIRGNVAQDESTKIRTSILRLIRDFCPQKLYRYRTCNDNNFDCLLNDTIYFSAPINFNDPHDCLAYVDMDRIYSMLNQIEFTEVMKRTNFLRNIEKLDSRDFSPNEWPAIQLISGMLKNVEQTELGFLTKQIESLTKSSLSTLFSGLIQSNHEANLKLAREETYIACLSERFDSTLMWAHYSDYHKGFVLEYDTSELAKITSKCLNCQEPCLSEHIINLYPVIYGVERYDATEYEVETINWRVADYFFGLKEPFYLPDQLFYVKSNTYKGMDWVYEKEWRLIYSCKQGHPVQKHEVVRPKAIYLGSRVSERNKRCILKMIEGKGMSVYEMYADDYSKKYALSYKAIG